MPQQIYQGQKMSVVLEFPKNKRLSRKEVAKVSNVVEEAIIAHTALKEYVTLIKQDPRLMNIKNKLLLKTLTLLLEEQNSKSQD